MKNYNKILVAILVTFIYSVNTNSQEIVTIPLTNPSKAGTLKLVINRGNIIVKGYSGNEIIVKASKKKSSYKENNSKKGLKRIVNEYIKFRVEEKDNYVVVDNNYYQSIDYEVKVPENFSLKLGASESGDIYVENVNGTMDVSSRNGSITLNNISGDVSADTQNKNIIVTFKKVTENTPMAFSSFNGDIDITLPKNIKADIKVKSERGEFFTDFDFKVKPERVKYSDTSGDNKKATKLKIERWITASINGGGPEFLFKNYNGNVIIRSK